MLPQHLNAEISSSGDLDVVKALSKWSASLNGLLAVAVGRDQVADCVGMPVSPVSPALHRHDFAEPSASPTR